ncbi:synaptic vesicle glycoprotein 2C [Acipenser ruthenus]|uniref:synaptic vesicle glycoprotein 2C n=1 Tax=Acipenser ruthenus TaxID=7906 RepID=UPI0027408193|nr:synaptic vesicle glycoprotein 2C [Acipenser ruthenus]
MSSRILEEGLSDSGRRPLLDYPDTSLSDSDTEGDAVFERKKRRHFNETAQGPKFSYEEAVEEAGFGLFHGLLLVVCGWANASDAVEILCVSFLLPTARCDLQLSSSDMGMLTASIFLGMMIGGYVWGYLADQKGRQRVLVISLTVNGVFGALASLAPWFWLFLLLRFISGIGVGGSIPVIFSYFSEFQPRTKRGAMISGLATFWMAGNILAAGLAWLVIPNTFLSFQLGTLEFQSWRLFVVLCSIPSLSSALIFRLVMPESPKFLMEAGRVEEAVFVFRKMYNFNHRGNAKPFPVTELKISPTSEKGKIVANTKIQRISHRIRKVLEPIQKLFSDHLTSRSVLLLIIFFCISFGYYGLWMWFPELFKRIEDGGSPCANASQSSSSLQPANATCYPVKTEVYMEGFITAAANLPGNIFTIFMMDVVGGKVLLTFSLLLSGVSVFFIWAVQTKTQTLIMSCVFSAVSVIAWNALDVIGTELYPTQLRSSALGFFTGVGRVASILGNVVFGQLVDTNCAVPILLVAALLVIGGVAAIKLPRTKHAELT